jgi:hypothetical protein
MKELTTQAVQQAKRGDRFIIENIEEKDFFNKANAVKAEAKKMGIALGVTYHAPIKTGMIFVK